MPHFTMTSNVRYFLLPNSLPGDWPSGLNARGFLGVALWDASGDALERFRGLFPEAADATACDLKDEAPLVVRMLKDGVGNPMVSSVASVLAHPESRMRVDMLVAASTEVPADLMKRLEWTWREPAIEELRLSTLKAWRERLKAPPRLPERRDDSFETPAPEAIGLEFSDEESKALADAARARGRAWNRAELELFAQTWSEHCKHKIFAAHVKSRDTLLAETDGLFKTHIRKPSLEILERQPGRALSVFVDNAGVLALTQPDGSPTEWAYCLKMETHNSPSAISPYGGASTGIVGVHRDILGTGLGALPVANWDVLCFETPGNTHRPDNALPPDVIRLGVIKGIEDGGNQSGIPTVQGSVVFDPSFAVKPLVFAGSVGLLKKSLVEKRPKPGLKLYCLGGATGADGLRGAVFSSRDLRGEDFVGSAVQVANAFVQRRLTDFLMEAQARDLIDVVTDNGAGGLASSVGEMAQSTNGATMDLTNIRLKYEGLHGWERLVSESQERMTVATANPEALETLAREWRVEFDRLGELNDSGVFRVNYEGKALVEIPLAVLHDACPRLKLETSWTQAQENARLQARDAALPERAPDVLRDFAAFQDSFHLCSREGVVRRFDHEVQGRTLRKPFSGRTGRTPQDGSLVEIHEAGAEPSFVLSHGLAPWRGDVVENTVHAFDEALRSAVLAGARLETSGGLDNFCWADPIPSAKNPEGERRLWRLVRCNETLSHLVRAFDVPLISGKDSMKNNSRDFACAETLVVSMGASAGPKATVPGGHFSRANDVLFWLPPLGASLRDSAWERVAGARAPANLRPELLSGRDVREKHAVLDSLARKLKERYSMLSAAVHAGLFRSAKDVGEGGALQAVFEMGLGRGLGAFLEFPASDAMTCFGEGLGGVVVGIDPHLAAELERHPLGFRRFGVVVNVPRLRFSCGAELDLRSCEDAYLKKTREGFWG
jgi:phosphoribosylformylglycinamidine synthase